MVIGGCEGNSWRYEIVQRTEGFFVRMRDLETGAIERETGKLFRTAAVAFAYAEMSAAFERFALASIDGEDTGELSAQLEAVQGHFVSVRRDLSDEGVESGVLGAWEQASAVAERRCHH